MFLYPNVPQSAIFRCFGWIAVRTPTQSLNFVCFQKEWQSPSLCACCSAVFSLSKLSLGFLRVAIFFQSLRAVADCLGNFLSSPPRQYQIHQNANGNVSRNYSTSDRPTVHFIHRLFEYRSRRHSKFAWCCLSHQCHSCQGP